MLTYAKESGSVDGYALVAGELISDGQGTSVDDRIVSNLMQQSQIFQSQLWSQQEATFSEKKGRWMEVVGFIANRGERDWTSMMNTLLNQWRLWRVDAKEEIALGEREWTASVRELGERIQQWNIKASGDASKEGAKALAEELGTSMDRYLTTLNARMSDKLGASLNLNVDTDAILRSVMKSIPSGLGVLNDSMYTANTTAGFTELLNLGLSGGMFDRYQKEMEVFQDRMEVMQAVKMGESAYAAFMEMLNQFNSSLADANKSMYDRARTDLRDASPYEGAPFKRGDGRWSIRYISDYSLIDGRTYKNYTFNDYQYYVNTTVYLKPLKGIGGDVDFNNPYTYQNLNADEINLYINLEQTHLTNVINEVFDSGGRFEKHSQAQMEALGGSFGKGYKRYVEGKALVAGGWYSAPIAPGIPVNAMTLAKVGGSIALSATLGPWAAFALNAAFTTMEAAQGDLTWKQAAVQVGVNAVITGLSVGAGDLVGSAFSDTHSFGAQLAVAGAKSGVTTVGNTFASSIQYNANGGFDFNQSQFTSGKTWSQAGLSFATSLAASAATIGMRDGLNLNSNLLSTTFSTGINTLGQNISVEGDGGWNWGGFRNIDGQKALIQGVGSYASSTATGGMRDGYLQAMMSGLVTSYAQNLTSRAFGREDEYSLDRAITVDTMSVAVEQLYNSTKEAFLPEKERQNLEFARNQNAQADDGTFLGTLKGIGNDLLSMGTGLVNELGNIWNDTKTIGKGISTVGEMTGNLFSYGEFATDDSDAMRKARQIEESKKMWASGEMQREIDLQYSSLAWESGLMDEYLIYKYLDDPEKLRELDNELADEAKRRKESVSTSKGGDNYSHLMEEPQYDEAGNIINKRWDDIGEHSDEVMFRRMPLIFRKNRELETINAINDKYSSWSNQLGNATNKADAIFSFLQDIGLGKTFETINGVWVSPELQKAHQKQYLTDMFMDIVGNEMQKGNVKLNHSELTMKILNSKIEEFVSTGKTHGFKLGEEVRKYANFDTTLNHGNYDHINELSKSFCKPTSSVLNDYYNKSSVTSSWGNRLNTFSPITSTQFDRLKKIQYEYYKKNQYLR